MAKHLYLPKLDDDANIPIPNRPGHWEKKDKGILLSVSDGITIAEAEIQQGISSIPDIWARPLMFQSAIRPGLKNPHPLRDIVLHEWRGLLSLLALANVKTYSIDIVPVKLSDDTFSAALRSLVPNPVQLEKNGLYHWTDDILMIYFDKIPIGAFSPTTLVYTATDYRDKLKKKDIPLKDEYGHLHEPDVDVPEDLEAVGEWLVSLKRRLKQTMLMDKTNPDQKNIQIIHDLLDEWIKEIREKLELDDSDEINSDELNVSTEVLDILTDDTRSIFDRLNVYRQLLYPLVKSTDAKKDYHSDMALELRRGRNLTDHKEVVIITPQLLNKNIKIWERIRLRDLGGNADKCLKKYFDAPFGFMIDKENIAQSEAIWVRPELYFATDVLYKAKAGNFLAPSEAEFNFGTKYLLPFKKEILNFFSPEQIKEILRPEFKEERDGVRFSFTLPIANGKEIRIEKFYKTVDFETSPFRVAEIRVPVLEIFPNYLDKNWRRYYVFQNHAEIISVKPFILDKAPLISSRLREINLDSERKKVQIVQISADEAFPEGLEICRAKAEEEVMGLVLIQKPQEPGNLQRTWKIGVDFGTSNTNVFRQSSTDEMAEQWHFELEQHLHRITASNNSERTRLLAQSFVPGDSVELPIPTTLRIFDLARKENLLLDYFIHFPMDYKYSPNIYADIKWDTESEKKTEYFIETLLFLLLIEVVKHRVQEIDIACSFPKAFSETSIAVFKGDWEQIIRRLLDDKDCVYKRHERTKDVDRLIVKGPFYEFEGIASGEYFASPKTIDSIHERANTSIAAICLDVGGGTTDISIWYADKIVADASILLAGRQISQLLQKNVHARELLFSREGAIALDEKSNQPSEFASRLNIILKQEELQIQEMLLSHANKSDIQWIRKMLAIEFCAISFYTAMLSISTDKKLNDAILQRISTAEIGLHWGGNAAKFINWINFGKYDKDGIASKMLSAVFFQCLKDVKVTAKKLSQLQSPGHKCEVSGGLVVMGLGKSAQNSSEDISEVSEFEMGTESSDNGVSGVVCGEVIKLKSGEVGYLDSLTGTMLFDENSRTNFVETKLDRLERFVEIVNFFGIRFGLFNEDSKIKLNEQNKQIIKDEVLSRFIKSQSLAESQRVIEPIFIMEVKVLLEILRNELR